MQYISGATAQVWLTKTCQIGVMSPKAVGFLTLLLQCVHEKVLICVASTLPFGYLLNAFFPFAQALSSTFPGGNACFSHSHTAMLHLHNCVLLGAQELS